MFNEIVDVVTVISEIQITIVHSLIRYHLSTLWVQSHIYVSYPRMQTVAILCQTHSHHLVQSWVHSILHVVVLVLAEYLYSFLVTYASQDNLLSPHQNNSGTCIQPLIQNILVLFPDKVCLFPFVCIIPSTLEALWQWCIILRNVFLCTLPTGVGFLCVLFYLKLEIDPVPEMFGFL